MDKTEQTIFDEELREKEIKRLTSPFTYDERGDAYDIEGNLIYYYETDKGREYILEPKEGILTDEEIVKYAWNSEAAVKARLRIGMNRFEDKEKLYGDVIYSCWTLFIAPVSVILLGLGFFENYKFYIIFAILFIALSSYTIYAFYLKDYTSDEYKNKHPINEEIKSYSEKKEEIEDSSTINNQTLKRYEKQVNDLKQLYEVKEKLAVDMIGKRFSPSEITYDKFISSLKSCSNLFYEQSESTLNIINLATDNTPKVEYEIKNRIDILKLIIEKVDELTNELVLNMSSLDSNSDEIRYLVEDMEKLIKSVKDYK